MFIFQGKMLKPSFNKINTNIQKYLSINHMGAKMTLEIFNSIQYQLIQQLTKMVLEKFLLISATNEGSTINHFLSH